MSGLHSVPDADAEAAEWFARLRSDQPARRERERFEEWRDSNSDNADAYDRLESLWAEIGESATEDPIMAMRREALALAPAPAARARSWLPAGVIAASLVAVFGMTFFLFSPLSGPVAGKREAAGTVADNTRLYRTGVGERGRFQLSDGSSIELNTDSQVRVAFTDGERLVELVRGEVLFDVAKDAARPFVVDAKGDRIVAHGTSFNVRQRGEIVEVTLIEGKVSVERERGMFRAPERAMLDPGQQLVATNDTSQAYVIRSTDVAEVSSWREGRLIFDNEPLSRVVAEINRYSERKIELGDPSLGSLRVTGVFKTGSPASFTTALGATFPVDSSADEARNRVILHWRPGEAE